MCNMYIFQQLDVGIGASRIREAYVPRHGSIFRQSWFHWEIFCLSCGISWFRFVRFSIQVIRHSNLCTEMLINDKWYCATRRYMILILWAYFSKRWCYSFDCFDMTHTTFLLFQMDYFELLSHYKKLIFIYLNIHGIEVASNTNWYR